MTGKHTPGPWVRDGLAIAHMSPPYGYPLDVCLMGEPAQHPGDTAKMLQNYDANARLITAAPDLLEALEGLLSDIQEYQRINNLGGEGNHWQVLARAALAKARGQA